MDLPDGITLDDVVIHGRTMRLHRNLTDYPELWASALENMRSQFGHTVAQAKMRTVSDLIVFTHYEKRVQLDERPDWADPSDDGPWFETVEADGDPDWDIAAVSMEVACVPQ